MKRFIKIGLIALLAIILYLGFGIAKRTGAMQNLDKKLPNPYHKVEVAPGAEDIQYDAETGLVFITADNRRVPAHAHDPESSKKLAGNGIYVVDVSPENIKDIGKARKVSPENFPGFRPHGLYFWRGEDGDKRLFVVNHRTDHGKVDEVIEIFQIGEGGMLTHLESISFPEMTNPNDVVAVGPRQFYATNYLRYHPDNNMIYAELLLGLPYSSVLYFDGEKGQVVADGLVGANGINISPDQKTVYVNEWTDHKVAIFDRNPDNTLRKNGEVAVPFLADNVSVEDILGKRKTVSSAAVKLNATTKKQETVFVALDGELNASSCATIAGDKLLIGSVFDNQILVCAKPN